MTAWRHRHALGGRVVVYACHAVPRAPLLTVGSDQGSSSRRDRWRRCCFSSVVSGPGIQQCNCHEAMTRLHTATGEASILPTRVTRMQMANYQDYGRRKPVKQLLRCAFLLRALVSNDRRVEFEGARSGAGCMFWMQGRHPRAGRRMVQEMHSGHHWPAEASSLCLGAHRALTVY